MLRTPVSDDCSFVLTQRVYVGVRPDPDQHPPAKIGEVEGSRAVAGSEGEGGSERVEKGEEVGVGRTRDGEAVTFEPSPLDQSLYGRHGAHEIRKLPDRRQRL
jgi:hypothetical protein